ncbi:hypothetical protein BKP35_08700 [Anaerobacillus arseniciselenatis]|uniref:Uncharacterized protein n=1 Tax=Anaerobacillus arseniciselenatis TaxID=85682 RepID=A0A1S2LR30_9BACI|nr:hypothetical protein [Anaerobacillus arseniciselenatis]OIJ13845.1 hypothetical protein BKP35_08700 [Anaerobacillus arseniciselenatis]
MKQGYILGAREIYETIFLINIAVTETYGIPELKYVCELMGYKGGFVRKSLLELSSKDKEEIKKLINNKTNNVRRSGITH